MTHGGLTLSLVADLPDARRGDLTRDLLRDLRRASITAQPAGTTVAKPGERGVVDTAYEIAILAFTHGTALILADCLKAYLLREKRLSFVVKTMQGQEIPVDLETLRTGQAIAQLRDTEQDP